jgi:hypothetical protein
MNVIDKDQVCAQPIKRTARPFIMPQMMGRGVPNFVNLSQIKNASACTIDKNQIKNVKL